MTVPPTPLVLYASFGRRLRALVLDGLVLSAVLLAMIVIASTFDFGQGSRLFLFGLLMGTVLLYEPLLLTLTGNTIGQRLANLRVVAPTPSGRLPFWQAWVRWLLKALTGLVSFVTMPTTQRNQALHDLPFGTTVQIRDPAKARSYQYIRERPAAPPHQLPPAWRRAVVVLGYWVASFIVMQVMSIIAVSRACLVGKSCTSSDRVLLEVLGAGWLGTVVLTGALGFQGRLIGCRRTWLPSSPATPPSEPGVR